MPAAEPLLQIERAEKLFGSRRVIDGLDLQICEGEIVSIVGPSGCGKSTLLRIIAGLDRDFGGSVSVLGHSPQLHSRDVGLIFQEPRLLPWLTIAGNVGFNRGRRGRDDPRIRELLEEVGLAEHATAWPKQLSGGMAQRAAIARGLFTQPRLLLLDEPFSAVDAFTRMRLQDLLLSVAAHHGTTLLMITHDISEAIYLSDRVLVLASRPAQLLGEVRVPLPRPRRRTHPMLGTLATDTMALLERTGTTSSSPSHGDESSDEADEATRHSDGEP